MFPKGLVRLLIRSGVEAARPDAITSGRILLLRALSFGSAPFVLSGLLKPDLNPVWPDTLDGHHIAWSFRDALIYSVHIQRPLS